MVSIACALAGLLMLSNKKNIKWVIAIVALVLVIISAFYFHPTPETDLQRYYDIMGYVKTGGWKIFDGFSYTKGLYLFRLLFYVLAMVDKETWLPIIAVLICYLLFMMFLNSKTETISPSTITARKKLLSFYLLILPFYQIVCGIRFWVCVILILILMYIDIIEKKHQKLCFLAYLILTQFHTCAFIFIAFRVLLYLTHRLKQKQKMLIALLFIIYQPIVMFLNSIGFFRIFGSTVYNLIYRMQFYLNGTSQISVTKYAFAVANLIFVIMAVNKYHRKTDNYEYNELVKYMVCFTIGGYYNFDLFYRLSYVSILFSFPLLYEELSNKKNREITLVEGMSFVIVVLNLLNHVLTGGYNYIF